VSRQPGAARAKRAQTPRFDLPTFCCLRPGTCFYHTLAIKADKQAYHILCYVILLRNTWYGANCGPSTPCGGGGRAPEGPVALFHGGVFQYIFCRPPCPTQTGVGTPVMSQVGGS
jgi:hypothetical protein